MRQFRFPWGRTARARHRVAEAVDRAVAEQRAEHVAAVARIIAADWNAPTAQLWPLTTRGQQTLYGQHRS